LRLAKFITSASPDSNGLEAIEAVDRAGEYFLPERSVRRGPPNRDADAPLNLFIRLTIATDVNLRHRLYWALLLWLF